MFWNCTNKSVQIACRLRRLHSRYYDSYWFIINMDNNSFFRVLNQPHGFSTNDLLKNCEQSKTQNSTNGSLRSQQQTIFRTIFYNESTILQTVFPISNRWNSFKIIVKHLLKFLKNVEYTVAKSWYSKCLSQERNHLRHLFFETWNLPSWELFQVDFPFPRCDMITLRRATKPRSRMRELTRW